MMNIKHGFLKRRPFFATNTFLILLGIFLTGISILVWRDQISDSTARLQAQTKARTVDLSSEVEMQFHGLDTALDRLASSGSPIGVKNIDSWQKNAEFFLGAFAGMQSISWVDPAFNIRLEVTYSETRVDLNIPFLEDKPNASRLVLWKPIYTGTTLTGFLVGTLNLKEFLQSLVTREGADFMFHFSNQGVPVHISTDWTEPDERFAVRQSIALQNATTLRLYYAPTPFFVRQVGVDSQKALFVSLAFVVMTMLALHFAQNQYALTKLSESRYRSLLEEAQLVAVIMDPDGELMFCNDFLLALTGYRREDLIGMNWFNRFLPPEWEHVKASFLASARAGELAPHLEYPIMTKNGELRWLSLNNSILRDTHGKVTGIASLGEDRTKLKQAGEEVQRQLQNLQALFKIDRAITSNYNLNDTLSTVLEQVEQQLFVDAASVLLFDEANQTLSYAADRGFRGPEIKRSFLHLGEGGAGRAALEKQMVSLHGMQSNSADFLGTGLLRNEGFVCYHAIPLLVKDKVKGVLELFQRSHHPDDPKWLEFFESLAQQTAIALDSNDLYTSLQQSHQKLIAAYDSTIEGWSHALDLRDKETENHTQRVTDLTVRLATALGFSETDLVHVRWGALLHDIGKMGIPDQVLFKKEPLDESDWALIHMHPVYAQELLAPIEYLQPAIEIPYCHHEKWDGSGYPMGLKGMEIPLSARLFAVVDVWDALLSDRPYRPGWPQEKVYAYLREKAGTHFDPAAVELFFKVMEEQAPAAKSV